MSEPRKAGPSLLVVDDEETILFALEDYFLAQGCSIATARSVSEAEDLLAVSTYDLVVADLRLAGPEDQGGLDLVRTVRRRCPAARVVLLTAYGSPEVRAEAERLGVDAFLHKPQLLAGLSRCLRELLARGPASSC